MLKISPAVSRSHRLLKGVARWSAIAAVAALVAACANPGEMQREDAVRVRVMSLGPAQVLLLGQQNGIRDHQDLEIMVLDQYYARSQLGALVLEMVEQGYSSVGLTRFTADEQLKTALGWRDSAQWRWEDYLPLIRSAVNAGVPVYGGNLLDSRIADVMQDTRLDTKLPEADWKKLQAYVDRNYCQRLPAGYVVPMARLQMARDLTLAQTISQAVHPGQVVVSVTESVHADRSLGIPNYLPRTTIIRSIKLAGNPVAPNTSSTPGGFDDIWQSRPNGALPACADVPDLAAPPYVHAPPPPPIVVAPAAAAPSIPAAANPAAPAPAGPAAKRLSAPTAPTATPVKPAAQPAPAAPANNPKKSPFSVGG